MPGHARGHASQQQSDDEGGQSAIGYVTRAIGGACTGGSITMLTATLPWHLQYESYQGTLPRMTSIAVRLVNANIEIEPGAFIGCLARTTEERPLRMWWLREAAGPIVFAVLDEAASIPLTGFFCAAETGRVSGTGFVTVLNSLSLITLRLI